MELVRKATDGIGKFDNLVFTLDECETLAVNYVQVGKEHATQADSHPNEEEIYVILSGEGQVFLNDTPYDVSEGNVIYVPRNTSHWVVGGGTAGLNYLCIANWPDRQPKQQ